MSKSELTAKQKEEIKQKYIVENLSIRSLAKQYKTTFYTVNKLYKKEKWKKLRQEYLDKKSVTIVEDSIERSRDKAEDKDLEHQQYAKNAVSIARACMRIIAKQMAEWDTNPKLADPLSVQRSINALKEAIYLERITLNLPTSVSKADLTTGGESFNATVDSLMKDSDLLKLAKELNIDVAYFKGLVGRVATNPSDEGQS